MNEVLGGDHFEAFAAKLPIPDGLSVKEEGFTPAPQSDHQRAGERLQLDRGSGDCLGVEGRPRSR